MLEKIIAIFFLVCVSVGMTILTSIYGWGLEPKSYFWILGVGIVGQFMVQSIVQYIGNKKQ